MLQGICILILASWSVVNVQIQFSKSHAPTSKFARLLERIQQGLQCFVVSVDIMIGAEMFDSPHYSQCFRLCNTIVLHIPLERMTCIG